MIALASDHGGFALKGEIALFLKNNDIDFYDYGTYNEDSVDYPTVILDACSDIVSEKMDKGIFICGTGVGISIAANKHNGIRAACVTEAFSASLAREHNNCNVLCLGGRIVSSEYAFSIVKAFLTTEFSEGERHIKRINLIEEIEKKQKLI